MKDLSKRAIVLKVAQNFRVIGKLCGVSWQSCQYQAKATIAHQKVVVFGKEEEKCENRD